MKFVSIDIETSGLDHESDDVLEVAMVIEDTSVWPLPDVNDLPFVWEFVYHERIIGQPEALRMGADIIKEISRMQHAKRMTNDGIEKVCQNHLAPFLSKHLSDEEKYAAAGSKVDGFDLLFFPEEFRNKFYHIAIEVGSVALGSRPDLWGEAHPRNLSKLIGTAGAAHRALDDARDVIRVLRSYTGDYGRSR